MAGKRRTPQERNRDLAFIAKLRLQGFQGQEVVQKLNERKHIQYIYTSKMLDQDYGKISKTWLDSTVIDITQFKAQKYQELQLLKREAWEAWEVSKVSDKPDPSYLRLMQGLIEGELKLFGVGFLGGVAAPVQEIGNSVDPFEQAIAEMSDSEYSRLLLGSDKNEGIDFDDYIEIEKD
ncbi:MAG: hypothetical protein HC874_14320 [Richelia sp. SL_2_1]|nr:hypothetical protein [Richelia sp. SL_2_1]